MQTQNEEIGRRVRSLREFQLLSREKLAEKANISTQFLSDIETGKKGMTVSTLQKLCAALCVTSDYIVFGADASRSSPVEAMLSSLPAQKRETVEQALQLIIKAVQIP